MKTTTILLLIAAAGLATGCNRNSKDENRYEYSDTTYRASDPYYPSSSSTTTTQRPEAAATTATTTSGTTVWHSTRDSQSVNRNQSDVNVNRNQSNMDQNKTGVMNQQNQQGQKAELRAQDQDFIKQAAVVNQKEVEMGRLAVRQGSSEKVRNFGQKLIDDHTKANDELTTMARQKNVDLTTQRSMDDRDHMQDLAQLQGADFDKQFIDQIIQGHQKAIDLFDRESRTGEDAQVKAFASRTLPTLRSHLQMAKDINTELEATDLGVPRRAPSNTPSTTPSAPRDPNQPIQPFDPNNPARNPNNPEPLNPANPNNPSNPSNPR